VTNGVTLAIVKRVLPSASSASTLSAALVWLRRQVLGSGAIATGRRGYQVHQNHQANSRAAEPAPLSRWTRPSLRLGDRAVERDARLLRRGRLTKADDQGSERGAVVDRLDGRVVVLGQRAEL
jgi:hypothetical protein